MKGRIWECKIGGFVGELPDGCDYPMRRAVEMAFQQVTGRNAAFLFSGWGANLTSVERAVWDRRTSSQRRQGDRRYNNVRRRPAYQDRWIHQCTASAGDTVDWASRFCPDCGLRRTTIYDRRAPIPRVNWDRREQRRRFPIERRIG